ncbi:MAG: hypothetical protein M1827_004453 [Pycnora praestabilis]|nr:MAG: hypothetical protein M1827_004453 [Pycnora praestabilis]
MAYEDKDVVDVTPPSEDPTSTKGGDIVHNENVKGEIDLEGIHHHGNQIEDPATVTAKTWTVVFILSMGYGLSFWPVPLMAAIETDVAAELGAPEKYIWFIPAWTLSITVCFMLCGANTDLFGRRYFLVYGNLICFVGQIVAGSAKSAPAMIAGMAVTGFGAANCQMAAFALSELLPNKWRHIGVVIADWPTFVSVFLAPVTGRYGIHDGNWRWNFYGCAIMQFLSFVGLYFLYFPPAHPLNLSYGQVFKELDYIGGFLFIAGSLPTLMGIVWTSQYPSQDPHVVAPIVVGLVVLIGFAVWETWGSAKHPLTPPHMFASSKGRDFTAPVIVVAIVNMFFYCSSILWPSMVVDYWTDEGANWKYAAVLSLVQGLAISNGSILLTIFGGRIRHWQWQLTVSVTIMVVFGSLCSLGTPNNKAMMIVFMFICVTGYGWGLFLAIAVAQMGVPQRELGTSGGIAGVFRFAAGSIGTAIYTTILSQTTSKDTVKFVPPAAMAAGAKMSDIPNILKMIGTPDLATSYSTPIVEAVMDAYQHAQQQGIRLVALSSIAFGMIGIIACLCCKDVDEKMNDHIEVFLENDINADRNEFH